nr:CASP-like protein 5C3 [Ipomoea trifida]GMC62288.1 CASP-like protein ARALYDRAFT_485429 [Ipomoea batatas]
MGYVARPFHPTIELQRPTLGIQIIFTAKTGLYVLWHAAAAAMDHEVPGAFGTSASLALRLGQTVFSIASLIFMCLDVEFYSYTAFCFLVTIMGLLVPWSLSLAIADMICIFFRRPALQPGLISILVLGDWVLSFMSLAASCSAASVADFLLASSASSCSAFLCNRYQLSAAMAILCWFLEFSSSLFNLWLLPSL